jgi:hypothetical protein
MFAIKTKARWLTHGAKTKTMLLSLPPLAAGSAAAVCFLLAGMTAFYGAAAVFETYPFAPFLAAVPALAQAVPALFFTLGALFTLCRSALWFTLLASFYYRTDQNQTRPVRFLSLKMGARALACTAQLTVRKCGWGLLLFSPALLTAGTLYALLRFRGLPPVLFYAGAGLAFGQTAAGAGAYFVLTGRYCAARYLMYLNPLLGVREAIRSSVLLTRGKRGLAAAVRLSMLPWQALCLFSLTRPFAFSYVRLTHAVLCETVYAEDKTKVGKPAVTFLVNGRTRVVER